MIWERNKLKLFFINGSSLFFIFNKRTGWKEEGGEQQNWVIMTEEEEEVRWTTCVQYPAPWNN